MIWRTGPTHHAIAAEPRAISVSLTDKQSGDAKAERAEKKTTLWQEIKSFALLLLGVLAIHSFVAKPFYIPSASMMPGLLEGDHLVVSKYPYGWSTASVSFHLLPVMPGQLFGRTPERGDIVIVEPNGRREDWIKRVIGLPGDTVAMRGGRLILNGRAVPSQVMPARLLPYDQAQRCEGVPDGVRTLPDGRQACEVPVVRETLPNGATYDTMDTVEGGMGDDFGPVTVPAGHVFLMGDNRDNSLDSRFTSAEGGLGGPVPLEKVPGRAEFITFSLDGSHQWWNPLSWFGAARPDRAGTSLRPTRVQPVLGPVASAAPPAAAVSDGRKP